MHLFWLYLFFLRFLNYSWYFFSAEKIETERTHLDLISWEVYYTNYTKQWQGCFLSRMTSRQNRVIDNHFSNKMNLNLHSSFGQIALVADFRSPPWRQVGSSPAASHTDCSFPIFFFLVSSSESHYSTNLRPLLITFPPVLSEESRG